MNDDSPRDARLTETAQAIHADNLHLLARLDADDCDPGIELDCTLNGAQEHIFDFFEALPPTGTARCLGAASRS